MLYAVTAKGYPTFLVTEHRDFAHRSRMAIKNRLWPTDNTVQVEIRPAKNIHEAVILCLDAADATELP